MKPLPVGLLLLVLLGAVGLCAGEPTSPAQPNSTAKPTDGFHEYTDTFKVQHPYDLKEADRFSEDKGVYTCWVQKSDKPYSTGTHTGPRTEMRWNTNWTKIEHMWEADVMFEPGTNGTCLMQVKSNTGGEPIYLEVQNDNLINNNEKSVILLADAAGKWFHVLAAYNPTTGLGRIWINGELKTTRTYNRPLDTEWYFKNGVYNTSASSKSHFKNIKFWVAQSTPPAK